MFRLVIFLLSALASFAQTQPVPYSHKTHLALGLKCNNCHKNADPGEMMGYPASTFCMSCHQTIKKDSPAIQKLAAAAQQGKDLPWVRVYQIPTYVFFSHRTHTQAGATCETCHGPVRERDLLVREVVHNMGTCMDCHRKNKASNDCTYCHEQRQ